MRLTSWQAGLLIGTVLLVGCQSLGHIQFVGPSRYRDTLPRELALIASKQGLRDRSSECQAYDCVVFFSTSSGKETVFVDLGAREVRGEFTIDIYFRQYGGTPREFKKLARSVRELLDDCCKGDFRVERNPVFAR